VPFKSQYIEEHNKESFYHYNYSEGCHKTFAKILPSVIGTSNLLTPSNMEFLSNPRLTVKTSQTRGVIKWEQIPIYRFQVLN
jgi:hypothetical protein